MIKLMKMLQRKPPTSDQDLIKKIPSITNTWRVGRILDELKPFSDIVVKDIAVLLETRVRTRDFDPRTQDKAIAKIRKFVEKHEKMNGY